MHIPSGTTAELELVTFEAALQAANTPNPYYDIDEWLYAPNFYSEYRYILGTRGKNPLICIGINPSTAQPGDLDNTLKSVQRIAHGNGLTHLLCLMFMPSGQRIRMPWRRPAIFSFTKRIWRHSAMCCPLAAIPLSGPPGARSSKRGTT